jgi:transposase
MILHPVCLGIDVSKHCLDIGFGSQGPVRRIANAAEAIEAFVEDLGAPPDLIVFEATGRYDRRLRSVLARRGLHFARVPPGRSRDFAHALGLHAKTDAIDARMLAAMGERLDLQQAVPVEAARERLALLLRRRDQLVAMRQQERLRLVEAEPEECDGLERHLAFLDGEITVIEATIRQALRDCDDLARQERLLRSVPGIGPVAATVLLALMPELGTLSGKAAAALAGLAPFNHDSGKKRGQRCIDGGRKRVRDALYMAAVAAARSTSRFADAATAMRDRNKPFKLVMIAVARKILVTANALIRQNMPFDPAR